MITTYTSLESLAPSKATHGTSQCHGDSLNGREIRLPKGNMPTEIIVIVHKVFDFIVTDVIITLY